jgi:hypothetical protein
MISFNSLKDSFKSFIPSFFEEKTDSSSTSSDIIGNHFCQVTEGKCNGKSYYTIAFNCERDKFYRLSFSDERKNEIKVEAFDTPSFNVEHLGMPEMRLAGMKQAFSLNSLTPTTKTIAGEVAKKIKNHILANKELWPSLPREPKKPTKPYAKAIWKKESMTTEVPYYPGVETDPSYKDFKLTIIQPTYFDLKKYEIEQSQYSQKIRDHKNQIEDLKIKRIENFNELVLMTKNLFEASAQQK